MKAFRTFICALAALAAAFTSCKDSPGTDELDTVFTITLTSDAGEVLASVNGATVTGAKQGQTVSLTAREKPGWEFTGWSILGGDIVLFDPIAPITKFTMPPSAVSIKANYKRLYPIVLASDAGEPLAYTYGKPVTETQEGRRVTVTVLEAEASDFKSWTVLGGEVVLEDASQMTTAFIMPAQGVSLKANFKGLHPITLAADIGDVSAFVDGELVTAAKEGQRVRIVASGEGEWRFRGWTILSGEVTLEDASIEDTAFIMPDSPVSLKANFKDWVAHSITLTSDVGQPQASLSGTPATEAKEGQTVTISVPEKEDWLFTGWTVLSGEVILADASALSTTFDMPDSPVALKANFKPWPLHAITLTADAGVAQASVNGLPATKAREGQTVSISAAEMSNRLFTGWTVLGGEVTLADASVRNTTFTMPASPVSLKATFKNITICAVDIQIEGTGSVDVSVGGVKVTQAMVGDLVTLKATPGSGRVFDKWAVLRGGITLQTVDEHTATFTMPDQVVGIKARFGFYNLFYATGHLPQSLKVTLARSNNSSEDLVVDAVKIESISGVSRFALISDEAYSVLKDCTATLPEGQTPKVLLGRRPGGTITLYYQAVWALGLSTVGGVYQINTLEELNMVRDNLTGSYLQNCDLDFLGNDLDPNTRERARWLPIGSFDANDASKAFRGIYDGGSKNIYNMSVFISDDSPGTGLFGCSHGTLKNINLMSNCEIYGNSYTGAICGYATGTAARIENCTNAGDVFGSINVGGICGNLREGGTIYLCSNTGEINARDIYLGGICGYTTSAVGKVSKIQNCTNSGNIESGHTWSYNFPQSYTGGICGSGIRVEITRCTNNGVVSSPTSTVGGICGALSTASLIDDCRNSAKVTCAYVGESTYTGGIVGYCNQSINNCVNTGDILSLGSDVGGICGHLTGNGKLTGSTNSGKVLSTFTGICMAGGICGYSFAYVATSANTGNVTGYGKHIGGVVGSMVGGYPGLALEFCTNSGTVTSTSTAENMLGGVCGPASSAAVIRACWNKGAVVGSGSMIGGVCGYLYSGTITACYSSGKVTGKSAFYGIVYFDGSVSRALEYCYWDSYRGADGGGAAGISNQYGLHTDCDVFSNSSWPAGGPTPNYNASRFWGQYANDANLSNGYCWKSIGYWNNGNPTYPQLWWEK